MTITLDAMDGLKATTRTRLAIIDCDIHHFDAYNDAVVERGVFPYLSKRWQRHHEMIGMRGHAGGGYPRAQRNAARADVRPICCRNLSGIRGKRGGICRNLGKYCD